MTDKQWSGQVMGGGQWCEVNGETLVKLDPHHYIHKSQSVRLRDEIRNGIRVCRKCHNQAHKDPKWFADWMHKNRPADKKYCDDILSGERKIKESQ